ncbi:hypothetical protein DPSP01_007222 [Paraphaeosphaeria sporulosa]|uniref:Uncharacterized protein n=1 Tax=Paraphaeosphaeria sporulosa TaxID=1460663 RepID=A0A177C479_9PLEO|nr:uncharacterized protein CC84DRAFT_1220646 [Paraphaeosphaeria sporulosa]OAG02305.1 hypothetical protein CC84DRAFT_1220646 [Paraphaeosphaeria sporulosa]
MEHIFPVETTNELGRRTGVFELQEQASGEQPRFQYVAHTTTKKFQSSDTDTKEYVVPVSDEDDELSQFGDKNESAFVNQLPMESQKVDLSSLKTGSAKWRHYSPKTKFVDTSMTGENKTIYCIGIPDRARNSNAIVYPAEKQYLRGIDWALTFNSDIVNACLKAKWKVAHARYERTPKAIGSIRNYYGLPDGPAPGPAYALGGYWIDQEGIDSSELLVRWLILQEVWTSLPQSIQTFVKDFAQWGTLKETSYPAAKNDTSPEQQPTKRVKYSIGGVELLQEGDSEDDQQS